MKLTDPRPATRVSRFFVSASARLNYEWALRRPGKPPFIVLTEFPRSGGNWIRDMLGDAMQLPVPRYSRLPVTFPALVHNHDHRVSDHPTVYVLRDPRDVFLSHFHKTVTTWTTTSQPLRQRIRKLHPSLETFEDQGDSTVALMERFYLEWLRRPLGCRVAWPCHVRSFLRSQRPNVTVIRYEDAHTNPASTLTTAIEELTGTTPDPDTIAFAVSRNKFHRQTGRPPGIPDNSATKRQGLAGQWRENLPANLASRIAEDLEEELCLAGYTE